MTKRNDIETAAMKAAPPHLLLALMMIWSANFITGCASRPKPEPPLPVPTTLFRADYFLGSPLSGSTAAAVPIATPTDSLDVQVRFVALENIPSTAYTPVGSRAVFLSSTGGGNAVLPAGELTRSASIADLKSPEKLASDLVAGHSGRTALMKQFMAALPSGVTATFAAIDPVPMLDLVTGKPASRSVRVMAWRPANTAAAPQIALEVSDLRSLENKKLEMRTELALFDLPKAEQTTTALIVPFQFSTTTGTTAGTTAGKAASKAIAVLIQISPGNGGASHIAATTDCLKQLAAARPTTMPMLATGEADSISAVIAAVQSLTPVSGRRASLAFLSDQTGAMICEDLAMEADDAVLAQLVQNIQAKVAARAIPQLDPKVGWLLDQTALELLTKLFNDDSNGISRMPAELKALLTTHTGEAGRHSSTLEDVLRGLSTREELDNRLLAQNLIFLEDSSPASRVRAFDWLNARHHAPAGYDPLGPSKARREALERAAGTP